MLETVRRKIAAARPDATFTLTGVPIQSKDKVLGVLGSMSHGPHGLSPNRVLLLTTIGRQIGIAVENARLAQQAAEVKIFREVDRLRSELIANVSHELRTPLGLIKISASSLLMDDAEFDRATERKFLHNISEETTKLETIVEHLLDLGRIESGRLRLDKQPTDLGRLVTNTIKAMAALSQRHRLVSDFPADPLVATVDAKRVEQVLRNLLDNTIKYSPMAGPSRCRRIGTTSRSCWPSATKASAFQPRSGTESLNASTASRTKSRDACEAPAWDWPSARASSRRTVDASGSESQPGAGSTFCFTLPLAVREDAR